MHVVYANDGHRFKSVPEKQSPQTPCIREEHSHSVLAFGARVAAARASRESDMRLDLVGEHAWRRAPGCALDAEGALCAKNDQNGVRRSAHLYVSPADIDSGPQVVFGLT